jgi:hypothetical protein
MYKNRKVTFRKSLVMGIKQLSTAKTLLVFFFLSAQILGQQINITRIEQMPNLPSPYKMRDWKKVSLGYDSLVFDFTLQGDHLPLIWLITNTSNYPNHNSFGLRTAVGTYAPYNAEAINILPAVISATLVGVDKSDQNGSDWVLMCEEFFNKRPQENVYLNNHVTSSGNDWWYDTMPNVFFYQLFDLYPNTGDFNFQFTTVADRWLEALTAMGASVIPWTPPYMNYRAFRLATMTPLSSGVRQPEAAGAIAWLLYNAYVKTGEEKYRIGAEQAIEFLNEWQNNPCYELQLPYGAYTAARINAELGTDYNIQKLVNWCFTPNGNVRDWGVTLGNWGGYDCYGLVGEAKYDGYAFIMNTFEQVGALVPLVRYDDRFARAIGKWVLNAANASRLFYTNYLPDENQDGETWAKQYDPNSYIAHEAMREYALSSGISPFATGDFQRSGWGATNYALYGSSHVGIFGGIIDTTDVRGILKLDALKTDYFHPAAYPTYLYYNPYDSVRSISLDVGNGPYDLYDAVSNSFLSTNVTGNTNFDLPADGAVLLVITPSTGILTYQYDKTLINGIVVDYLSGQSVPNYPLRIKSLAAAKSTVMIADSSTIYCCAEDLDNDPLNYLWDCEEGLISGDSALVKWIAPDVAGLCIITCVIDDGRGGIDSASIDIEVLDNHAPEIMSLTAQPREIELSGNTQISCNANDIDADTLIYIWTAHDGVLSPSDSQQVSWQAPATAGYYFVTCRVNDGSGGEAIDSIGIVVGRLVAFYPFNNAGNDASGFENHGSVFGAVAAEDRFGNSNSAYYFDGSNDYIRIPNHASLNNQHEICISFWIKIAQFFDREAYPISHGNWENRWKVSVTNKGIRWTIKTTSGIKDLDSQTILLLDSLYHVAALYNGSELKIYINGILDAASNWSGLILKTDIDLAIAQHLPGSNGYNFKGVLDDIRIYNHALSELEIRDLYDIETGLEKSEIEQLPQEYYLSQNYPNPFNSSTVITYQLPQSSNVVLDIYNIAGQKVATLISDAKPAGYHRFEWRAQNLASGVYYYRLQADTYVKTRKLLLLK